MRWRSSKAGLLGALVTGLTLRAEGGLHMEAQRISGPIQLDGRLDEAAWREAPAADGFHQSWPRYGRPAPQRTEVKVLFDDRYLYIGARLWHLRGLSRVVRRLHRRDQDSSSDWFGVHIDSLHDRRSALAFHVNAAGVQRDGAWYADTAYDPSWDGVWDSAVAQDADGWSVELRIPLSLLRLQPGAAEWGINFSRSDQGPLRATSWWSLAPRDENAFVSRFPALTGLASVAPTPRREWIPYLTWRNKFATAQSWDDRGTELRGGLDGHLALGGASQLDLALKPDFGQVEVDQAVLNLGTTETWLPEKRPFFVEGADLFAFQGPQLFYSRRIGHGLGTPSLGEGERLVATDRTQALLAAAKVSDRDLGGAQVALLGATARTSTAQVLRTDGIRETRPLEPAQAFLVARGTLPLAGRNTLGGLATWTRKGSGPAAAVVGLDGTHRDPELDVEGALVRTATATEGWYARARAQRRWAGGWAADLTAVDAGHDFDPNDLGYLARADEQRLSGRLQRRLEPLGPFQEATAGAQAGWGRDQAGHVHSRWISADFGGNLTTFYGLWGGASVALPAEDDQELRTFHDPRKKYLERGTVPSAWLGFDTPGNRAWTLRASWNGAWHPGGPSTGLSLSQTVRPAEDLEIAFGTSLSQQEGELRYLATEEAPLVGLRRLSSFNQTLQVAFSPRPDLSLQVQSQWLAANWNFRDIQAWQEGLLVPRDHPEAAFSARSWNLNVITRWEVKPGSALFIVYSRGVATDALINARASLSPSRDLMALRALPGDEVVQMKFSYLLR